MSDSDWSCDKCTFLNATRNQKCDVCGASKPKYQKPKASAGGGSLAGVVWACPLCTCENPWKADRCGACETAKPQNVQFIQKQAEKPKTVETPKKPVEKPKAVETGNKMDETQDGKKGAGGDKDAVMTDKDKDKDKPSSNKPGEGKDTKKMDVKPDEPKNAMSEEGWDTEGDFGEVKGKGDDGDDGWDKMDTKEEDSAQPTLMNSKKAYQVMTVQQVEELQRDIVKELVETFNLPFPDVIIMLRAYNWRKNELEEAFFADQKKVEKKVGFTNSKRSPDKFEEKNFTCPLCAEDVTGDQTCALRCEHRFCNSCWKGWIQAEFDKGPGCINTKCPSYKCPEPVWEEIMIKYLDGPQRTKFRQYLLDNFITGSRVIKWCPGTKCTLAARYTSGGQQGILCDCQHAWCFKCAGADHSPVSCVASAQWLKESDAQGGNANYILANTKACPKCQVNIEKNQGCQHMTCSRCRHEFCWLCMRDWRGHSACNTFGVEGEKKREENANEARKLLMRYVHFFDRYSAHNGAIAFAQKTRMAAMNKMAHLQELRGSIVKDVEFLVDAVNNIIECRRVLAWTYVYGYFLRCKDGSSERLLFETHQQRLEEFTDRLHELTESPLEMLMEPKHRTDVIHLTSVIEKYRKNVIETIETSNLPLIIDEATGKVNPKAAPDLDKYDNNKPNKPGKKPRRNW